MRYAVRLIFITIFLFGLTTKFVNAQRIFIQPGLAVSSMKWNLNSGGSRGFYPDNLLGPSVFIGAEYADKNRFSFSSSLGFLRVGGSNSFDTGNFFGNGSFGTVRVEAYLDYLSLNTLVQYRLDFYGADLLFGAGPRMDFVVNKNRAFDGISAEQNYNPISIGLVYRAKIIKNFGPFFGGVGLDYHQNFFKVADWPRSSTNTGGSITTQTALINAYFGCKLNKKVKAD